MIRLFQYMFYRIECIYRNWGEGAPNIPSTIIISGCQTFNILTTLPLIINLTISNWLLIIVFVVLDIANELYVFSQKRRETFADRWKDEEKLKKRIRGVLIIMYIVGSVALYFCALGWYTGYTGWKWEL